MLIEIRILTALQLRAQKEMRKILLETGGRGILIIKWQKTVELYPTVMWKAEFVSNGPESLGEEISKQYAQSRA